MKLLLDTNALIWQLGSIDGDKLGVEAKKFIQNADVVYASSVNVLEIRIKTMLGKLNSSEDLTDRITAAGLEILPFDLDHADALTYFPTLSKHDQVEGIQLLTSDSVVLNLDNQLTIDSLK